jgi:hypothetical protein
MRGNTALFLALALTACGPASVSGTVGGQSVDVSDAVFEKRTTTIPFLGTLTSTTVVIGSSPASLCEDLAAGIKRKGTSRVSLVFSDSVVVGEYVVGNGDSKVQAGVSKLDAVCSSLVSQSAGAGKVVITRVSDEISGTFDLAFGADRITGAFSAHACVNGFVAEKNCL